jgi:hypothetical protein
MCWTEFRHTQYLCGEMGLTPMKRSQMFSHSQLTFREIEGDFYEAP